MKLLSSDFFREESQFVSVEARAPQPLFPLHEHDFHEIVIVASGNGWHVLNDEPPFPSCAEIFYLQTGDRHSFEEVHDLYLTNVLYRQNGGALHPERIWPYLQPTDGALGEHFSHAFTKLTGVSPNRYRELAQRTAQLSRRAASRRS